MIKDEKQIAYTPIKKEFHPFLGCPKCKTLTLVKCFIPLKDMKATRKADRRYTLICDKCKFNFSTVK